MNKYSCETCGRCWVTKLSVVNYKPPVYNITQKLDRYLL